MPRSEASTRQHVVEHGAQVGGRGQQGRDRTHRRKQAAALGRRGHFGADEVLDLEHLIDVRALQLEYTCHAGMRRDAGQVRLHPLEQRTVGLGAQVTDVQHVARGGVRIDQEHRCARVREDVRTGLVEELKRQRDVRTIDVVHMRDIRHVRCPVGVAGCDEARHDTLEAGADRFQRRIDQGCAPASGSPARGPGVCAKALVGVKRTACTWFGADSKTLRTQLSG